MKTPTPNQRRFIVYVLTIGDDQWVFPTIDEAGDKIDRMVECFLWKDALKPGESREIQINLDSRVMSKYQIDDIIWADDDDYDKSERLMSECMEVTESPHPTTQPAKGGGK